MALLISDVNVYSLAFASIPRALISPAFASRLGPAPHHSAYLFTTSVGNFGPISFSVQCSVSSFDPYDIVLGLDWAAYFRDSLLHSGLRLGASFDSWAFFSSYIPPRNPAPHLFHASGSYAVTGPHTATDVLSADSSSASSVGEFLVVLGNMPAPPPAARDPSSHLKLKPKLKIKP
ncbi:hypothetical protein B0H17DRAFT_1340842 [Mycena rosella]|uniref:Uncharacterized protein n=1 Tax=Mycena rosella TaxID=1033263 RepID=A0AAD7BF76_MYCRO|nr:hypothetical protein B0H17DRAFT_1340842 [Mycena rosella]